MSEDRRMKLLERFVDALEKTLSSDLPKERKMANAEALYLAFCTATNKQPNYELINHL